MLHTVWRGALDFTWFPLLELRNEFGGAG